MELLYVPAGKFMMGSADDDSDAETNERPRHEVQLSAYWIGRIEVTVGQWRKVTGTVPTPHVSGDKPNSQGDEYPVEYASWSECDAFCRKLGLRLPTEAEWEYAARGPESRKYPWGAEWDQKRCCNANNKGPKGQTFPAGALLDGASWCGALDLAGNVWEWCADEYADGFYRQSPPKSPRAPDSGMPRLDQGTLEGVTPRVIRGGSWLNPPSVCRAGARTWEGAERRHEGVGFRVARDL
jgi:formylglycine-generating enzyme required for sulfatase activity